MLLFVGVPLKVLVAESKLRNEAAGVTSYEYVSNSPSGSVKSEAPNENKSDLCAVRDGGLLIVVATVGGRFSATVIMKMSEESATNAFGSLEVSVTM